MTIEICGPGSCLPDPDALNLLATGRGSLAFLLGDEHSRFRLYSGRINWDRVLLARLEGRTVGFLAFQWAGEGPYNPKLADFMREFGQVSGFFRCMANRVLDWRNRRQGFYVYGLKVIPEARRSGVAGALLAAAECQARTLDADSVELEVYDTNMAALAFYAKHGYEVQGVWRLGILSRWLKFSAVLRLAKSLD